MRPILSEAEFSSPAWSWASSDPGCHGRSRCRRNLRCPQYTCHLFGGKHGETVNLETPFGSVRVREDDKVDPKRLGVPVYPGAVLRRTGTNWPVSSWISAPRTTNWPW